MSGPRTDSARADDWRPTLRKVLDLGAGPVHLVGVGNWLRADDAVGLEVISTLRSEFRGALPRGLKVHPVTSMPERLLSKLASEAGRIVVFDAVEAGREPGDIVCCSLAETRFGFFATHNIPFRLVPGLAAREKDVYIVGVQPESLDVREGLTERVAASGSRIVSFVVESTEGRA